MMSCIEERYICKRQLQHSSLLHLVHVEGHQRQERDCCRSDLPCVSQPFGVCEDFSHLRTNWSKMYQETMTSKDSEALDSSLGNDKR